MVRDETVPPPGYEVHECAGHWYVDPVAPWLDPTDVTEHSHPTKDAALATAHRHAAFVIAEHTAARPEPAGERGGLDLSDPDDCALLTDEEAEEAEQYRVASLGAPRPHALTYFDAEHTATRPEPAGETERKIQALGRMDVALARARRERAERQHGCVKGRDAAEPAGERDTVTVTPTAKAEFVLRAAGMWPPTPAEPSEVERLRAALVDANEFIRQDRIARCTGSEVYAILNRIDAALAAGPTEKGST